MEKIVSNRLLCGITPPPQPPVRLIRTSGRRRLFLNRSKMPSVLVTCRLKSKFFLFQAALFHSRPNEPNPIQQQFTVTLCGTSHSISHRASPCCSPARRIGPMPLQRHADLSYRRGGTPRIQPCDIWTLNKLRLVLQVSWIGDELVSTAWSLTLKRGGVVINVVRRSLSLLLLLLLLIHPKF